jgi:hypothetical protein
MVLGNYRSGRFCSVTLRAPVCSVVATETRKSPAGEFVISCNPQATLVQVPTLRCPLGRSSDVVRARRTRLVVALEGAMREDLSSIDSFAARVRARLPRQCCFAARARTVLTFVPLLTSVLQAGSTSP